MVPKAAPKAPPKEAPGFFEDLLSGTPSWALGGAALVAARRRKTTKFEDSIISGTDIKTNTVFGSTGGGVVNTGDNSLASDFSREGLGNIDTDEVDPIAEAEVYLAYGRDAQAEEILKIKKQINGILAGHCEKPVSQIEKDTDRDYYMSSEEAKAYGIIDNILLKKARTEPKKEK